MGPIPIVSTILAQTVYHLARLVLLLLLVSLVAVDILTELVAPFNATQAHTLTPRLPVHLVFHLARVAIQLHPVFLVRYHIFSSIIHASTWQPVTIRQDTMLLTPPMLHLQLKPPALPALFHA